MRIHSTALVQFRILGPVAALRDDETLTLGGERQRALLAVLLIHAGDVVSTESLIEQLFDGRERAANAVHVAVSRLRRALGDGAGDMLLTRPGGYVLELEQGQLDVETFERLFEEGRTLLARGDPTRASVRLGDALGLWRGPPFADVVGVEDVQAEARRLEELRLLAEMERIDAELALGHAAQVVVELERLTVVAPLRERLRAQLMLALYRSGRQAEALGVYRETCSLLREELGLAPSEELRELEHLILRHDSGLEGRHPGAADARALVCPFKGLAAFQCSDAPFFCGRDGAITELVARLAEWPLVGILGPSGIGKSSLLRAGVMPALASGALPGSSGWRQVLMRPGQHPSDELRRALGGDLAERMSRLDSGERLVIAVDQLEELFTLCEGEDDRRDFLDCLVTAAGDEGRRTLLLCTLRADFYGRLSAYPEFAELLSRSHVLVGPMNRDEIRQAIEQPAARAGLEVEDRLVDVLVTEVGDEPGSLPLLSTTLLELWRAREGRVLRLHDYRSMGGVRSAVARIAEVAYRRLAERDRRVARHLLLRLADIGDGSTERRRVPLEEIRKISGADRVLAELTDARLLTIGAGAVELCHEALLREWPRYRAWLEEDRVERQLHAHLRVAASEWEAGGRDPGDLYRGTRLAAALEFRAQHPDRVDGLELSFVAASQLEADREADRQRAQNRRLRALLAGASVLLVLTVLAGVVAAVGQRQASRDARLALAEAHAALGRQLAEEALSAPRLDMASLLAREAVTLDRSPQTDGTLLSTLLRSPAVLAAFSLPTDSTPHVAISPDGRTLAVSDSAAGTVRFYDADTRTLGHRRLVDFVGDQPPVYADDGSLLIYPSTADLVVRDARTLAVRRRLLIGPPYSRELASDIPEGSILVSPEGQIVYYAYWLTDPTGHPTTAYLARWDLTTGRPLRTVRLGTGPLLAVRLLDGGARVLVVTPLKLLTYAASARVPSSVPEPVASVRLRPAPQLPATAAISPDGARAVIGSRNGSVSFVDTATGQLARGLGGDGAAVAGAVFARDGERAMTAGDDGTVIVWNARTGDEEADLPGPAGHIEDAQVSPDGSTFYTAGVGGLVLAWDLTGTRGFGEAARLGAEPPCCDSVSPLAPALAMSPDGTRFAAAIGASTVGVFSTRTLRRDASFTITPSEPITALAWSHTGSVLAVGAYGGLVQLWGLDSTSPHLERSLAGLGVLPGQSGAIQALAFSPDGQVLAATEKTEGTTIGHTLVSPIASLAMWTVGTGVLLDSPSVLGSDSETDGSDVVAFSDDGKLLAASLLQGGVRVFDASTGQALRTLADPGDDTISLAFAPRGALLAAGTLGGTVELWDPVTGKLLAQPLLADSQPITSLAFDPLGDRFTTTGAQDGSIKLWFTQSLQQEGPALAADPGATATAAFEPHSGDLTAIDTHGRAFTWPMSLTVWERRACSLADLSLSPMQWTELGGAPRNLSVCPSSS